MYFCIYYDRTVGRQEAKWETERGGRDRESTTALFVGALPTRLFVLFLNFLDYFI